MLSAAERCRLSTGCVVEDSRIYERMTLSATARTSTVGEVNGHYTSTMMNCTCWTSSPTAAPSSYATDGKASRSGRAGAEPHLKFMLDQSCYRGLALAICIDETHRKAILKTIEVQPTQGRGNQEFRGSCIRERSERLDPHAAVRDMRDRRSRKHV
jgi:hypothetical protein